MPRRLFMLLALPVASLCSGPLAASAIEQVVVYPGLAEVTRSVPLSGKAGAQTITVAGLPVSVDVQSVAITAPDGVQVGGVTSERVVSSQLSNPREAELNARLQALQDKRSRARHAREAAQLKLAFIQRLAKQPAEGEQGLPVGDWSAAWAAAQRGAQDALDDTLEQDIALRGIEADIQAVQRELDTLASGRRDTQTLHIDVTAARAVAQPLRVQYTVRGASWRPSYRARLDTEAGTITLDRQASVRQNTGEDWNNVRLTLATGRPRAGTRMPTLPSEVVRLRAPELARQKAARGQAFASPAPMMDAVAEEALAAAPPPSAIIADAFAARYVVGGRVSAPSDNTERQFGFGRTELPARIEIRVTPMLDTTAYLYADFTNTADTPLPAGPVELLRDNTRAGRGRLPTLPPGQAHELGFGADEAVQVDFVAKPYETDETLFRGRNVETREFVATVRNGHRTAYPVLVVARVPVPGDDSIKVKPLGAAAQPDIRDLDDRKGVIAWRWQAPAGGERRIEWGHELSWPGDKRLQR